MQRPSPPRGLRRAPRPPRDLRRAPSPGCAAVSVTVLAMLLSGCGSYTKHDFVTSANAICASAVRQVRVVPPPASTGIADTAGYLAKVLPIVQSEDRQIHALRHPSQSAREQAALRQYLSALSSFTADFARFAQAARSDDRDALANAEAALRASPLAARAASYGLSSCGTPGPTVS